MVMPSAIGSVNGTPISTTSAASGNGRELLAKLRALRIACGEERHQRRLAAARALAERRHNPLTWLPSSGPRKQFARAE